MADEELDWFAGVEEALKQTTPTAAPKSGKPAPASPTVRMNLGAATTIGKVRERNEDFFLTHQWAWNEGADLREGALVVVADGMGGYAAGDQAARLTAHTVLKELMPLLLSRFGNSAMDASPAILAEAVEKAIKEANRVVIEQAQAKAEWRGMGATAAVVLVWNGWAIISHVGDCRVYHLRAGKLTPLTRDQTVVNRLLELRQITPAEAANHPSRNDVTQCIGKRPAIEPSRQGRKLLPGDMLVVACDGLAAHVSETQLQQAVSQPAASPSDLARKLVQLADQGGGTDNCTVAVVKCL